MKLTIASELQKLIGILHRRVELHSNISSDYYIISIFADEQKNIFEGVHSKIILRLNQGCWDKTTIGFVSLSLLSEILHSYLCVRYRVLKSEDYHRVMHLRHFESLLNCLTLAASEDFFWEVGKAVVWF